MTHLTSSSLHSCRDLPQFAHPSLSVSVLSLPSSDYLNRVIAPFNPTARDVTNDTCGIWYQVLLCNRVMLNDHLNHGRPNFLWQRATSVTGGWFAGKRGQTNASGVPDGLKLNYCVVSMLYTCLQMWPRAAQYNQTGHGPNTTIISLKCFSQRSR